MLSNKYKTVLVTGASSGIGEATVRLLCRKGYKVSALARRKSKLIKLSKETGCENIIMDIRNIKEIEKLKKSSFDIFVNNAGLGRGFDKIYKTKAKDISTTIDTNVQSFLHLLRCVVPGMVRRKKGHVINIGSIAGLYPLSSSVYGGSKGAVHLISQNLRLELSGTGVRCTEINPGRVDTEFFDIAFDSKKEAKKMKTGLEMLKPLDIARSILFSIEAPAHVNISSIEITPTEQAPGGVKIEKVL
jgi:3-hydroxy acid dehydrogenase/malonic semialdehyde reductase